MRLKCPHWNILHLQWQHMIFLCWVYFISSHVIQVPLVVNNNDLVATLIGIRMKMLWFFFITGFWVQIRLKLQWVEPFGVMVQIPFKLFKYNFLYLIRFLVWPNDLLNLSLCAHIHNQQSFFIFPFECLRIHIVFLFFYMIVFLFKWEYS
jgi:hypothetical protein